MVRCARSSVIELPSVTPPPGLVIHADWSVNPKKRWMTCAVKEGDLYQANLPELVGDLDDFLQRMRARADSNAWVLLGVDFPIGLPFAYAKNSGINSLLNFLPQLGHGDWKSFFHVAETAEQISIYRPFYPKRPGGTSQKKLLDRLGFSTIEQLLRECEKSPPLRRRAAPLFWTLGAQQVGKAALNGWLNVIIPGMQDESLDIGLWPFSGTLQETAAPGKLIIAETYPADLSQRFNLTKAGERFSKRNKIARSQMGYRLLRRSKRLGIKYHKDLRSSLTNGFGAGAPGEDPFDAMVGLTGMLSILSGDQPHFEPTEHKIRHIEGWIFGLNP
jgi:hypothetical protein